MHRMVNFAKTFGLKSPAIVQAPMAGGITTPSLVASVSNRHALGSFATGYLNTEQVKLGIRKIKELTKNPFSVNIFIPNEAQKNRSQILSYQHALNKFRRELGMKEEHDEPPNLLQQNNFREIIDVLLDEEVKIISFTFGNLPTDIINTLKKNNAYLIGTATSLEEGKILADSGIDAIVAQGYEAGGHRGGFFTPYRHSLIGTIALIPQMVAYIDLPIIAAGGIMNGQSIVSAMSLGASAVQMGTAFLTTKESGADSTYKTELTKQKDSNIDVTRLTEVYSGKMARGINTTFIDYMESRVPSIPPYPITNILSGPVRKEAVKKHAINIMSMWAGQGVPLVKSNLTADKLLEQLRNEIQESIDGLSELKLSNKT